MTAPKLGYTGYSDLRKTLLQAMRDAENAFLRMHDEDGASDDDLAIGRKCEDAITTAWRMADTLADET